MLSTSNAQQEGQYSLYMYNEGVYNPAYAGLNEVLSITGVYRTQWAGLSNAPEHQYVHVQSPLFITGGGVGFLFEHDQAGVEKDLKLFGEYAHYIPLNNALTLSLGLRAGIRQKTLDGAALRTPQGNYESGSIDHNDGRLPVTNVNEIQPEAGAGLYLMHEQFEFGFGVTNLMESSFTLADNMSTGVTYDLDRTYFVSGRYHQELNEDFLLIPTFLVKSNTTQTQIDVNVMLNFRDLYQVGLGIRGVDQESQDAVLLSGGMRLSEQFMAVYAYDMTLSELKSVSSGSHEILLRYTLNKPIGKGRLPKIIYNPRYY